MICMVLVTCFGVSLLKIQVWDAMPCWLVHSCWHYEVRQYLLLQGQGIQKEWYILDSLTLERKHCTLSKHQNCLPSQHCAVCQKTRTLSQLLWQHHTSEEFLPATYVLYALLNHAAELAFSILCFSFIKVLRYCTWSAVGIFFISYTYS